MIITKKEEKKNFILAPLTKSFCHSDVYSVLIELLNLKMSRSLVQTRGTKCQNKPMRSFKTK